MQTNLNTRTKQTHGPTARQTIGPATLGQNSAPLEGYDAAPVQIRLARGSVTPSSEVLSRSRVGRPPSGTPPRSGAGPPPPRAWPRLDRGPNAPSSKFLSRSRASRAAAPIPAPPTGVFNALMPADVRFKGESTPLRAWESRPAIALPTPVARPSPPLCDAVRCGQQPPRGTVPPTPVRPAHYTLEKGRRNPRRDDARLLCARTGRCRDIKLVGAVTSVAIGPVQPSPHRNAIPATASPYPTLWNMRRQDSATPATVPCTASCQRHPQVLARTAPERATSTPPPSKPLLETHRARHDAPSEEGFARTTVYSVALYVIPLHVAEIVWHTCKLLPPWPIKGGAVP
jgi:hypothetical protein